MLPLRMSWTNALIALDDAGVISLLIGSSGAAYADMLYGPKQTTALSASAA
jgi:hypothetical protein